MSCCKSTASKPDVVLLYQQHLSVALKDESLISVHVGFFNSYVLVKVKCFPGSQARDKRQFMCKSASEGAVQFCAQAVVQCVKNLHQNTSFRLKLFVFTDFVLLCTAD